MTGNIAAESLGAVKVSLFPGKIGIDFANHVDAVFREKVPSVRRLVLDMRGNPGGGIGGLHLMSYQHRRSFPSVTTLIARLQSVAMTRRVFQSSATSPSRNLKFLF